MREDELFWAYRNMPKEPAERLTVDTIDRHREPIKLRGKEIPMRRHHQIHERKVTEKEVWDGQLGPEPRVRAGDRGEP